MTGEEFRAVYDQMCAKLGRLPTVRELAFETDLTDGAVHWHLRYRGLPFKRRAQGGIHLPTKEAKDGEAPGKKRKSEKKALSMRVYYIDPPKPPERGALILPWQGKYLPGVEYDARDVRVVRCWRCGRWAAIFPRTHIWWLPVGMSEMAAVCSDRCAGMMTWRRLT